MIELMGCRCWVGCAIGRNQAIRKSQMPVLIRSDSLLNRCEHHAARHTSEDVQLEMTHIALAFLSMAEICFAAQGASVQHFASDYWGAQLPVPRGS
jgi:hypothetical protein